VKTATSYQSGQYLTTGQNLANFEGMKDDCDNEAVVTRKESSSQLIKFKRKLEKTGRKELGSFTPQMRDVVYLCTPSNQDYLHYLKILKTHERKKGHNGA